MTAIPQQDSVRLVAVQEITSSERAEMHALLSAHFEGVSVDQFARDLDEKNWAIQIRRGSKLCGFSTLLARPAEAGGETVTAIYSGDTIVAPEAWNSPTLARAWIAAVNQLRAAAPDRRCFWLLLSSGFRTYRLLPVFWREFFPRHDSETPQSTQRLLVELARQKYGDLFDPVAGVVHFAKPQVLCPSLRLIPTGRKSDPHVAFFLAQNPGHDRGDELVCITEICEANLTRAGRRMISG